MLATIHCDPNNLAPSVISSRLSYAALLIATLSAPWRSLPDLLYITDSAAHAERHKTLSRKITDGLVIRIAPLWLPQYPPEWFSSTSRMLYTLIAGNTVSTLLQELNPTPFTRPTDLCSKVGITRTLTSLSISCSLSLFRHIARKFLIRRKPAFLALLRVKQVPNCDLFATAETNSPQYGVTAAYSPHPSLLK